MSSHSGEIVAVLGAGSWGSAIAHIISEKGLATRLWSRSEEAAARLTSSGENDKYLRGASLKLVEVGTDLAAMVADADWIVAAVPCAALPEITSQIRGLISSEAVVISGTKGLHPQEGLRASQIWERDAGISQERIVALSGPNLAREVAGGVPTSAVAASQNEKIAAQVQNLFSTPAFRVYTNTDLIGVELGGALKNVVAIAAGISDGLKFGDNSKAALITRAWHEMTRLAMALGATQTTLFGLSGMGDLIATCVSPLSRNRLLGEELASGNLLEQALLKVGQTAEGVHTTRAALKLAFQQGVPMPVTEQIAAVLFEGRPPREAVASLMQRQGCSEF